MPSDFAAADRRIRLLRQAPQGIVAALNNAIAAARAPYLARLDADDRARPDRLGKQLAFMEAHPEIGRAGPFAGRADAAAESAGPPADALTAPPDWWAKEAETSFFADDVGLYRLLAADAVEGPRHIRAVRERLFRLNHVERRLAQMRLRAMLREIGRPIGRQHL